MPRKYHMSWEGPPKYRWVKMYKGVRYRVGCEQLGAMVWTQEGSARLANEWWEGKLAELAGPSPVARALAAVEQVPVDKLQEMMLRGEAVQKILAELPFVKAEVGPEEVARIVGGPVTDGGQAAEKLGEVVARVTGPARGRPDRTFRHHAERFLALTHGECGAMSYREIHDFVTSLYGAAGAGLSAGMDVSGLNEERVEAVFLWLKAAPTAPPTKKKRWGFFKRLVRYCWEARAIDLPRNLDSRAFKFKVQPKSVTTYGPAEVRGFLAGMKPRLRLYALLGLNCGMTNVDIGGLRKDQVDLGEGRLVRKRVKTALHERVPTVSYPLWPETISLLRECWSDHRELALTSADGTALYSSRFEGKGTRKKDLLVLAWRRAGVPVPLKAFRSIAATLLETHPSYGRYKSHFLGHSPKSVADKHYAAPSPELFDQAVGWLHDQVFRG